MKKINRITAGLSLGAIIALSMASPVYADDAEQPWAVNESAAGNQDEIVYKYLKDLAISENELYAGYGDYSANIGPINIISHNLDTGKPTNHMTFQTEDINTIRNINGKLYMPNIDPKAGWKANVGYATNVSGVWQDMEMTPFIHVFDVASTGDDLWLSGSIVNPDKTKYGNSNYLAAVKRSVDGGATWTIEKTASSTRNDFDRYYWLAEVNGKIYTQATLKDPSYTLDVWENGVWAEEAIPFNTVNIIKGSSVEVINNNIIFRHYNKIDVYNTVAKEGNTVNMAVFDLYVDQDTNTIYSVGSDYSSGLQTIYSSKDGIKWHESSLIDVSNFPKMYYDFAGLTLEANTVGITLAIKDKNIYLGTSGGTIYKKDLTSPNPGDVEQTGPAVVIVVPSETITLKELSKPMAGVKATTSNGQDVTNLVTNKKKSNLRGTTVVYTLNYNGETFIAERKVLM